MPIYQLIDELIFPPVDHAEDGVLAVGGDLSPERLMLAYHSGIFPWFNADDPIIWWSPDPRFVLFPNELRLSRTTKRILRNHSFDITYNKDFRGVIEHCSTVERADQNGTWITPEMKEAYLWLHELGHATSVEVWKDGQLAGGMYGVDLGKVFCAESMFTLVPNASKVGLITFIQDFATRGGQLIDCQIHSEHMAYLGAREIGREVYLHYLNSRQ